MSEAERAVAAALTVECKKDGLAQLQSGNWKLTLTVADMPTAILSAAMGTRYQAVFVEVDDTEQPVERPQDDTAGKITECHPDGVKAKNHFEASCQDSVFSKWLLQRWAASPDVWPKPYPGDRAFAKILCGVESANEFLHEPEKWYALYEEFKYRDSVR